VSLEDQRARIEAYCEERRWRLAEVLADDGVSGGRRERLDRLAERVTATHARAIVVYHLDRFARDLAATLDYLRRFSRRGVELHVVGRGQVEADTATGFIVTAVEGLAAEHYRRVISEKTRDALARLRANGRRVSRFARYGFQLAPGRRLIVNPREQSLSSARSWRCEAGGSRFGRSRGSWQPRASWLGTDAHSVLRLCWGSFATGRLGTHRCPERVPQSLAPANTRNFEGSMRGL